MPSTFRECTEDTKGRNYKVYGTKGTETEKWANENEHTFIEISQDTAVLTPLPEKYTDADGVLTADVIGFNRTYQWYANDTNDNTTGTPIEGATAREFNPADYPAKYYYCVVTSTDVGYDPIEIRTNVTENTTYQSADYTEYNKAVEQAKSLNRDDYVEFSKVDEALAVDVSGKNITEQDIVDKQTKAILEAIDSLTEKDKPTEPPVTEPEEPTVPPTEPPITKPEVPVTKPIELPESSTNHAIENDIMISPETGDNDYINVFVGLMIISFSAICIVTNERKRKKAKTKNEIL